MTKLEHLKQNNQVIYRLLKNSYLNNKLAHAYLFASNQAVDLSLVAEFLIELLISETNLFNLYHPRNISTYPDLHILDGAKNLITKDNLKHLFNILNLKTLEDNNAKILYLKNIELANHQALNALLKFLENPTSKTYLIMTSNSLHQVIPTIKSRVVELKVQNTHKLSLMNYLIDLKYSHEIAEVISSFAISESAALAILSDENFIVLYNQLINLLASAYNNPDCLLTDLSKMIQPSNYILVMNILLSFIQRILNFKANTQVSNKTYKSLIKQYSDNSFDYETAFSLINQFLIKQKYHLNFNLAKYDFIISLEKCFK